MKQQKTLVSDCYVYLHIDYGNEIVYVGIGREGRCLHRHKRKPEHAEFIKTMTNTCGLSFIQMPHFGITEDEAREIETSLIKKHKSKFNLQQNGAANAGKGQENHNSVFSSDEVEQHRDRFSSWLGSMRSYHREHLSGVAWTTARKLLLGTSYSTGRLTEGEVVTKEAFKGFPEDDLGF